MLRTKKNTKVRETSRSAGLVRDFKQVRPGTIRAAIVTLAGRAGGAPIHDVLALPRITSRVALMAHLFCLHRDCAYGYVITGDRVTLSFPGGRTWRDAVRPEI